MNIIKYCQRCGIEISDLSAPDVCAYQRHIRVKYCDECSAIVTKEKTALRMAAFKQRKKVEHSQLLEEIERLKSENEALREHVRTLRNKIKT